MASHWTEPSAPLAFTKKASEFEVADAAWTDKAAKPGSFKYTGKAQVGGAHSKEFWTDEAGDRWLFKPAGGAADDFIAHGEEAAYKIARLIDPHAIEVRTVRLNGKTGSIQKWRTDLKSPFDFDGVNPVELTTLSGNRSRNLRWRIQPTGTVFILAYLCHQNNEEAAQSRRRKLEWRPNKTFENALCWALVEASAILRSRIISLEWLAILQFPHCDLLLSATIF